MLVELVTSESDIKKAAEVLLQLRPQYSIDAIITQIEKQQLAGYHLACAKLDGEVIGVAGFVIGEKLAWGKHIYVDDLVTDEKRRSSGVGAALINWLRTYGKENGCQQLHLDSGVVRYAAHRFYLLHGFHIASHHFSITDLTG